LVAAVLAGQQHTVTVEKLGFGGSALTHIDGLPIFIENALPGQQLEIVITKRKDNFAEAKVQKVIRKSKDEIQARCPHFGTCGGCQWQNLAYDKQLGFKEQIVRETLEHLTPVDEALRKQLPGRVLKIIPSPQVFHYRNKLEMSFGYTAMKTEEKNGRKIFLDEGPTIGFHRPGQWQTVLPIHECHLYDEQTDMLLADVRRFMEFYEKNIDIRPCWVCPVVPRPAAKDWALYPMEPGRLHLNFGFWESVATTPDLKEKGVNAGAIAKAAAAELGGSGGGRPDFAQGGGSGRDKLQALVKKIPSLIK
jgi:predicted RNA-binding protein with TRAM domain